MNQGYNAVGFQCQQLTSLNVGSAVGQVSWTGSYVAGNFDLATLNAGAGGRRGFWVFANNATSITYSGVDVANSGVDLSLNGYNLVSFCNNADIPGSSLVVTQNGVTVPLPTVVLPQFFEIGPTGAYSIVDVTQGGVLKPGKAYWVFAATSAGPVRLSYTVPVAPSPSPGSSPGSSPATSPAASPSASASPVASPSPNTTPVASSLIFTTQPAAAQAAGLAFNFVVTVRDQFGRTFNASPVPVALSIQSGPAGATFDTTAVSGTGTVTLPRAFDKAGSYVLRATSGSLVSAVSNPITVTNTGTAARLGFLTQPTAGNVNQALAPFLVQLQDAFGNPINSAAGTNVELIATGGTLATSPITATIGAATNTVSITTATVTGATASMTLTANATALSSATSASFAVAAGGANKLVFSSPSFPQVITSGATIPVTVQIRNIGTDVLDTTATNTVTLSLVNGPAGATLGGGATQQTQTASGGQATFNLTPPLVGATYQFAASAAGFAPVQTMAGAVTVNPGAAASIRFTVQPPVTGVASTATTTSYTVEVLDANGNRKTDAVGAVTLTLASGLGQLFNTATVEPVLVNVASGLAAFTTGRLPVGQAAAVVQASFSGVSSILANPVRVTADPYKNGNLVAAPATLSELPGLSNDSRWQVYGQGGQIFRRDRYTGTIVPVSVQDGTSAVNGNGTSSAAQISDDGNRVVFVSDSTNLVAGYAGGAVANIYMRRVDTLQTLLISRATAAATTGGDAASAAPYLSADGSRVGFETLATNLNTGNALLTGSTTRQIMLAVLTGSPSTVGSLTVASVNTTTPARANAHCFLGGMSSDGINLVYRSDASNLNGSGTNQVFRSLTSGAAVSSVTRVSSSSAAGSLPTVSDNGLVAYLNTVPQLVVFNLASSVATTIPTVGGSTIVTASVPVIDRTGSNVLLNYTAGNFYRVVRLADNSTNNLSAAGVVGSGRGILTAGAAFAGFWSAANQFSVEPGP